jgi:hypothetical protein
MVISNPISKQGIVDKFEDLVTDVANTGIVWGTDSKPFAEMPDASYGGTTAGDSLNITGANISGTVITATTIKNVLETEAALYTNIRQQRAIKNIIGAGTVFDQTQVAHLDTGDRAALGAITATDITAGSIIDDTKLETYFSNIATAYNNIRTTTVTETIDVCHSSCHSSCHGSRGRR